ncbi:JAB domain-containing protein [Companilactobacillus ginsenosidimutans]|uniref:JAB domain-containing protein n=1 Tax=Companilactobacillus ginsenosidimutans TaxID=1007676 RepID=UPI001E65D3D9|nr:JAB domain-containing protein [Companilactobacillus ginsenosidimutans]
MELGARKIERESMPKEQISLSQLGKHLIKKIGNSPQEKLVAVYLDNGFHIIKESTIFIGTVDSATVHPRDVLREGLRLSAPQVIICHNHPGGSLSASPEDERFSERLKKCCELVGINLVDHIIVTPHDFLSFKAQDLI